MSYALVFSLVGTNKLLKVGKNEGATSRSKSDKNTKTETIEDNGVGGGTRGGQSNETSLLDSLSPLVEKSLPCVILNNWSENGARMNPIVPW